ncbi:MAG: terminase [Clostridia bacterium]|nr:terminase [Clostridia bacterium]
MTSYKTPIPPVVESYLQEIESGEYRNCKRIDAVARYIRHVFETEDLTFEAARCEKYLSLEKYFPFELFPWEKAQVALWLCTYRRDGFPRWSTLFDFMGRGGGKDGFISFVAFCLISPYNPASGYDVDICANNEYQAQRPLSDLVDMITRSKDKAKLDRFYHTKIESIKGRSNGGTIMGRTGNPGGKDGMRSGVVILNEVHAYQDYALINVFETGLGKKDDPRTGIFSSNGDVSDGPLDDYIARADRILFEGEDDRGFLPFCWSLDDISEIHDPLNWYKANPSMRYLPVLQHQIANEYEEWKREPENHSSFPTKRMGIRAGSTEQSVTAYENVRATNVQLPDMSGWTCTVGLDYAELNDWAAINLHFKQGSERFDLCHAWMCANGRYVNRIKPNWRKWVDMGLLTVVEDATITPEILAEYVAEICKIYNVVSLVIDHFRWTLVSQAFEKIGFDPADKKRVKLARPSDIMTVEPVIQDCFTRHLFRWGDNPMLRWATQNTKRVRSSKRIGSDTGNYYYAKIEYRSRKTDPFMALVHSMIMEKEIDNAGGPEVPLFGAIEL